MPSKLRLSPSHPLKPALHRNLPFHVAKKKIQHIDVFGDGQLVRPSSPNGIKLEKFIFDAFYYSKDFLIWQVDPEKEFSPLKVYPTSCLPYLSEQSEISERGFGRDRLPEDLSSRSGQEPLRVAERGGPAARQLSDTHRLHLTTRELRGRGPQLQCGPYGVAEGHRRRRGRGDQAPIVIGA